MNEKMPLEGVVNHGEKVPEVPEVAENTNPDAFQTLFNITPEEIPSLKEVFDFLSPEDFETLELNFSNFNPIDFQDVESQEHFNSLIPEMEKLKKYCEERRQIYVGKQDQIDKLKNENIETVENLIKKINNSPTEE